MITISNWKKHMAHEKAVRDSLAICNDIDPSTYFTKDTEGSFQALKPHEMLNSIVSCFGNTWKSWVTE